MAMDVQGFSQGFKAKGFKRAIWLSIGVMGVVLTLYQCFKVIRSYLQHPYSTKLSQVFQDDLQFPFVSLSSTKILSCRKMKHELNQDPTDFVVSTKWDGMEQPVTGRQCEDVASFCSIYYQGAKQYIINYLGELSTLIIGEKSGLEVILKIPQSHSGKFGIVQDMDAFFCDFVPPSYISGGKRYQRAR
ncbi:uncharacterized protein LOC131890707 [Tigriopus californicus]|uniref:uncharacterized protein LOC131890707 n=1 Tax=Tigriopus californicus TaxID=6832 RepID=UPI0027DA5B32|nr:uncharacterized protein LOC131890707 [Tigriopus californicus]